MRRLIILICSIGFFSYQALAQSQAPRLLILDKNMSAWERIAPDAEPWIKTGCTVEYRRYYPFLVKQDLQNYDAIEILGGRMPLLPSAQLTRGDVELLKKFHQAGKGIILAYPVHSNAEGTYDRAAMNQFLREIQANIQIGDVLIQDQAHTYQTLVGQAIFVRKQKKWPFSSVERVALGDVAPLKILKDVRAEIFAVSYKSAYFPKGRLNFTATFPVGVIIANPGPVLLLSRSAFEMTGPGIGKNNMPILKMNLLDSTRTFLADVAGRFMEILQGAEIRLTPAAMNSAIPARSETRLASLPDLADVPIHFPYPVQVFRFSQTQFPDNEVIQLQNQVYLNRLAASPMGKYIKNGVKAIRARLPGYQKSHLEVLPPKNETDIKRILAFMKQAQLNILWATANPQAMTDTLNYSQQEREAIQGDWETLIAGLQKTKIAWLAGMDSRDFRLPRGKLVGLTGVAQKTWPPFDHRFWWQGYFQPLKFMAQILANYQPYFQGIVLDTEFENDSPASQYLMGHDFSEATFRFFLASTHGYIADSLLNEAKHLKAPERFPFLAQNGLLPLYYNTLEDEAERFGRKLRRGIAKISPNSIWGIFTPNLPGNWYLMGLLRGLSRPERPVLLFTREPVVQPYMTWLRDEDIYALHALAIYPLRFRLNDLQSLLHSAANDHQGFWISSWEGFMEASKVTLRDRQIPLETLAQEIRQAWNKNRQTKN